VQPNPRGLDWWIATAGRVRDVVDPTQRALLDDEIALQRSSWARRTEGLPRSAIHADLFRDNALFVDTPDAAMASCGVIDFYFAGDDVWALDLAICLNDWCIDLDDGAFDDSRLTAFVDAYDATRALTPAERAFLPQALRAAALRFWLSRLDDLHRPRPAQLLTPHDPAHFERVLRRRRDDAIAGRDPLARKRH
jgi:homoserine kinase type II